MRSLLAALWRLGYIIDSKTRLSASGGEKFKTPFVGVGSLLCGGAGKTPYTYFLADTLRKQGIKPAILCHKTHDEDVFFARRGFDVFTGNRFALAKQLDGRYDILISDDGLEDRRLRHAFWVCLTWGESANTLRDIIPLGNCRSLWKDHSNIGCVKRCAMQGALNEDAADLVFFMSAPKNNIGNKLNASATAIAGIARPERFFTGLCNLGYELTKTIARPDHDKYFEQTLKKTLERNSRVVITEKDSMRLSPSLLENENIYISKLSVKENAAHSAA